MSKLLLTSIVLVPVLLAMRAATARSGGSNTLLAYLVAFNVFWLIFLYGLAYRWVG